MALRPLLGKDRVPWRPVDAQGTWAGGGIRVNAQPGHILEDFQKLICCKARRKVMILQGNGDLIPYMTENIRLCDDPPGTYLFATYDSRTARFVFNTV